MLLALAVMPGAYGAVEFLLAQGETEERHDGYNSTSGQNEAALEKKVDAGQLRLLPDAFSYMRMKIYSII